MNIRRTYFLLLLILFSVAPASALYAQSQLLGKISFPNSGSEEAQGDFMKGMLYLHNFEYEDAMRAFRSARETDPGFVMAYYGEAKAQNHPLWAVQYTEEARSILNELAGSADARQEKARTQREKDLLYSMEVLYGTAPESTGKPKEERDDLYQDYMAELHAKYPDDHEITVFYGLSILGTAHEGRDFAIYMKAAAEMMEVWDASRKHPGAAHYLIHSFDDPVHAPLGLPMARAYSEIAPAAAHAQHMTSHIFLALGMWEDVIDANIVARDVQNARQAELNERQTRCGHYTWWLEYGHLQEGRQGDARQVLDACYDRVQSEDYRGSEPWHFAVMRAHFITDTRMWDAASTYTFDLSSDRAARHYYFANTYAHIMQGHTAEATESYNRFKETGGGEEHEVQVHQLQGLMHVMNGDTDRGMENLRKAAELEAELPIDFGPPTIVKPSNELLGEVLLKEGNYKEAAAAFTKQLARTPNRLLSLKGLQKAQDQLN